MIIRANIFDFKKQRLFQLIMKAICNWRQFFAIWSVVVLFLLTPPVFASDHADPIRLKRLSAGLTGLFAFPKDDQLVVIVGVRRGLTGPPESELSSYTYSIYIDLHSEVAFDSEEDRARYGGTVVTSEDIRPDVTIMLRLNDDATLQENSITGLTDTSRIRLWTGVRDDPFIFPRFFGTNIVAMVVSIPISSFPEGQQDWLIWATSKRGGKQIDHVGRANRTMLPRFDFLNTLPPNEHVAALQKRHHAPGPIQDVARTQIMPLFAIRPYDFAPDVMLFTTRFPAGFPNGRLLTDDVAALTCEQGDCLLWEVSFADSSQWPRQTTNDKPFLDEFPYLAEPWPHKKPAPMPGLTKRTQFTLAGLVIVLVGLLIAPWVLYIQCRRKQA
jgi:hypothetical protein